MSLEELKSVLRSGGIVGAGGAGFPAYGKLAEGADALVINCAECEPLIYTDYVLMREELGAVVEGVTLLMRESGIPAAYLAVKRHRAEMLGLVQDQKLAEGVVVRLLPDAYPMGDEIQLIYEATGRLVRPGCLPITAGVIVYNAETVYNIRAAIKTGAPVTEKWVTVGGDIPRRFTVRVPVGMRVAELFAKLGVEMPARHTLLDGGPSMGKPVKPETAVVTKTTKSLLILPDGTPAIEHKAGSVADMLRRAASCCCGCSRCTEMCPRNLLGYPLEPHKMIRAANNAAVNEHPEWVRTASLCCSCGVCAEVCCQDISPKDVILTLKGLLGKNKMRYAGDPAAPCTPDRDRGYRTIPSARWETMLGVTRFDVVPDFVREPIAAERVEIPLAGHIGAPSVAAVKAGDAVKVGDVIAEAAAGLSLPQHASIDGVIDMVDEKKIVIKAR